MSKAQGGQRCVGHAGQALDVAESRYQAAIAEAETHVDERARHNGHVELPFALQVKGRKARMAVEDALARYASTPQGDEDLSARMEHLRTGGGTRRYPSTNRDVVDNGLQLGQYEAAVAAGRALRARNTAIAADVKAGLLTGDQAAGITSYPGYQLATDRKAELTAVTERATNLAHWAWVERQRELGIAGQVRLHFRGRFEPAPPAAPAESAQDNRQDSSSCTAAPPGTSESRYQAWAQTQPVCDSPRDDPGRSALDWRRHGTWDPFKAL